MPPAATARKSRRCNGRPNTLPVCHHRGRRRENRVNLVLYCTCADSRIESTWTSCEGLLRDSQSDSTQPDFTNYTVQTQGQAGKRAGVAAKVVENVLDW